MVRTGKLLVTGASRGSERDSLKRSGTRYSVVANSRNVTKCNPFSRRECCTGDETSATPARRQ